MFTRMHTDAPLTTVMKTLADPTRRAVFERIARNTEVTAGSLITGAGVSQPAVSQHLRALRDAGLVVERRQGRHVHYRVQPKGLRPLVDWIGFYAAFWRESLDRLEELLKDIDR